ncbi:MAG: helix-turn-helix transcriptional regulator [Phycisphaeraceae bacterium]|nr:helix-turn-helix transcriptional regulator [Phycisphaeraceae bacterium]
MKKRTARPGAKRSPCPVAATLDLIGDKWSLLIIRDLFAGSTRFRQLAASPERIATNILASRLERLTAGGLIAAKASSDRAGSSEYHLTERGRSLLPLLGAMRDWGLAHISGTQAKVEIPRGS